MTSPASPPRRLLSLRSFVILAFSLLVAGLVLAVCVGTDTAMLELVLTFAANLGAVDATAVASLGSSSDVGVVDLLVTGGSTFGGSVAFLNSIID